MEGAGIILPQSKHSINRKLPEARNSIHCELQAIAIAIDMCTKNQHTEIYTDSQIAIHALETTTNSIKNQIRSKYQTERQYIQSQISKKKLNITFIKVKGHSNNVDNDLVDEEAKKGTESILQYTIEPTVPILINSRYQPVPLDSRQWLKMHHQYKHLLNWQHQQLNKQLDQETIQNTD